MLRCLVLATALICSGCAVRDAAGSLGRTFSMVPTTTTTFSDEETMKSPQPVFIYAEPDQGNDMAFQAYRQMVSQHMEDHGYHVVEDVSDAKLSIVMSYGAGSPRTHVSGSNGVVSSSDVYTRFFRITFIDNNETIATEDIVRVYQSDVTSSGDNSSFHAVSECLINAAFRKFPDKDGAVRRKTYSALGCVQ